MCIRDRYRIRSTVVHACKCVSGMFKNSRFLWNRTPAVMRACMRRNRISCAYCVDFYAVLKSFVCWVPSAVQIRLAKMHVPRCEGCVKKFTLENSLKWSEVGSGKWPQMLNAVFKVSYVTLLWVDVIDNLPKARHWLCHYIVSCVSCFHTNF